MRTTLPLAWRLAGIFAAVLIGVTFFFAILGMFGFTVAIGALALFLVLGLLIFRRPQAEGAQR